jgi:hypothetical protein
VICETPVLGDDFILGNSKKTPRNLQEGPQLLRHNPRLFHHNSEVVDVICQNLNTYIVSCP